MFKQLMSLIPITISTSVIAFDFEINDHIEIPAVCEHLPSMTSPIDLSPACLTAQIAAQSYPPLLPAANQLCQTLEGITAGVGVIQLEVNSLHEMCQSAMDELENQMFSGLNEFHDEYSRIEDLISRFNNVRDIQELLEKAIGDDDAFLEVGIDEWERVFENPRKPAKQRVDQHFFEQVASAEYLAENMLGGNTNTQIQYLESVQRRAGQGVKIKDSQDITARIAAELVFQQLVFQQLLSEYLRIESAEAMQREQQKNYYRRILQSIEEG